MDRQMMNTTLPMPMAPEPQMAPRVTVDTLREWTNTLQRYKTGKRSVEDRVVSAENWWKIRNTDEEKRRTMIGADGTFVSQSAWLHNVINSKHADAMDSFPAPTILPREQSDEAEAQILSAIVPVVLEQNYFERTYDAAVWQKLKTGTGVYKVVWNKTLHDGMGDIEIDRVDMLNVFWEPGITDVQKSKMFFQTELQDNDVIRKQNPELKDVDLKGTGFISTKFLYDDHVPTDGKSTVIEVYYRKLEGDNLVLHYCKFVGEHILFSTENDPQFQQTGLYDGEKYPYVFDPLFPVEGSPCGYGFVDLCRNPQTEIDLLNTAFLKNAMAGATPRYFARQDGNVNEQEFLDLTKAIVHVNGDLEDRSLRKIDHNYLDGSYLNVLTNKIDELRETAGNNEAASGAAPAGVTSGAALAALQEASGKTSRASTRGTYRAYCEIVEMVIERIRQFYDAPRQFRVTGKMGENIFVTYSNKHLKQQPVFMNGKEIGYRAPVFDIKVDAQKKSRYSTMAQNELAMQFFGAGFFNPQLADQALMCIGMMEFDGKDKMMQQIQQNGTMYQMLGMMQQYAVALASKYGDQNALMQLQQIMGQTGGRMPQMPMGAAKAPGIEQEPPTVKKAKEKSAGATQPDGVGAEV